MCVDSQLCWPVLPPTPLPQVEQEKMRASEERFHWERERKKYEEERRQFQEDREQLQRELESTRILLQMQGVKVEASDSIQ